MTILGISIGTTRIGIAVLQDQVLVDRQIHNYQAVWSEHKLRIIANRLKRHIVKYRATAIMVKIPPLKKHTKAITQLLKKVEVLAHEYGCEFDLITKSEIKHVLMLRSTNSIIEFTKMLYPELTSVYQKGVYNDHLYYKKLYEAVIASYIFQERLIIRKSRKTQ